MGNLLSKGHWSLVIGHWSLVIGHWSSGIELLPITYYLLPITYYPSPITHHPSPITPLTTAANFCAAPGSPRVLRNTSLICWSFSGFSK